MKPNTYDETKVFMDEIHPLMEKVHALCTKHELPLVMYCQYVQEDDPNNADQTRAGLAQMVFMPGPRAMPVLHAVAEAATKPAAAALRMLAASMGHVKSTSQDEEDAMRAKAKDSTAELLAQFMKPGNA